MKKFVNPNEGILETDACQIECLKKKAKQIVVPVYCGKTAD